MKKKDIKRLFSPLILLYVQSLENFMNKDCFLNEISISHSYTSSDNTLNKRTINSLLTSLLDGEIAWKISL